MISIVVDTNFLLDLFEYRGRLISPEVTSLARDLQWLVSNGWAEVVVPTQVWLEFVDRIRSEDQERVLRKPASPLTDPRETIEYKNYVSLQRSTADADATREKVDRFFADRRDWLKCIDTTLSVAAATFCKRLVRDTHLTRKDALVLASLVDLNSEVFIAGDKDFTHPDGDKFLRPVLNDNGLRELSIIKQARYSCSSLKSGQSADKAEQASGKSTPRQVQVWSLTNWEARQTLFTKAAAQRPSRGEPIGIFDRFRRMVSDRRRVRLWYTHDSLATVCVGQSASVVGSVIAESCQICEIWIGKKKVKSHSGHSDVPPCMLTLVVELDHNSLVDPVVDEAVCSNGWRDSGCDYCELLARGQASVLAS